MSIESARAYMSRVQSDTAFREQIEELSPIERAEAVREAGFDFTVEEITEVLAEAGIEFEAPEVEGQSMVHCIYGCIIQVPTDPPSDPPCIA